MARVVRGMNASPHPHLMGAAPEDVTEENKVLEFGLTKKAALDRQHNDEVVREREKRLESGASGRR